MIFNPQISWIIDSRGEGGFETENFIFILENYISFNTILWSLVYESLQLKLCTRHVPYMKKKKCNEVNGLTVQEVVV